MSFSTRKMQLADWKDITFFKPREFVRPERMGWEFMHWLDEVRARAGVKMPISSSYRTEAHNKAVGGAKDSAHTDTPCDAVDIVPDGNAARFKIVFAAEELGCKRIGIYQNGSIHLDRTEDSRPAPRLWIVVENPA